MYTEERIQSPFSQVASQTRNFRGHLRLSDAMKLILLCSGFISSFKNQNVRFALQPLGQCG